MTRNGEDIWEYLARSTAINQARVDAAIKKHDAICKVLGNKGCNCTPETMGCKFNNWVLK